jgi:hypothetical protein
MKLARCQLPVDERATQLGSVAPLNAGWVRFGGEVLLYAEDTKWNDVVERAQQQSLRLQEHSDVVEKDYLHLVIQNGRCFQQEHPEVQVLFDKGRYLAVALDPEEATQIDGGVCFGIKPLKENTRAFDVRARAAERMAPPHGFRTWWTLSRDRTSKHPSLTSLPSQRDSRPVLSTGMRQPGPAGSSKLWAMPRRSSRSLFPS